MWCSHTHDRPAHTHTHKDVAKVMAALDEADVLFRRLRDEPSKVNMNVYTATTMTGNSLQQLH